MILEKLKPSFFEKKFQNFCYFEKTSIPFGPKLQNLLDPKFQKSKIFEFHFGTKNSNWM